MVWGNLWKVASTFIHPDDKRQYCILCCLNNDWCFVSIKWVDIDLVELFCEVSCWEESGLKVANILNEMISVGSYFVDFSEVDTHPKFTIMLITYLIFFAASSSAFSSLSMVGIFCSFGVRVLCPMVMMRLCFTFPCVRYHPRPHADGHYQDWILGQS